MLIRHDPPATAGAVVSTGCGPKVYRGALADWAVFQTASKGLLLHLLPSGVKRAQAYVHLPMVWAPQGNAQTSARNWLCARSREPEVGIVRVTRRGNRTASVGDQALEAESSL